MSDLQAKRQVEKLRAERDAYKALRDEYADRWAKSQSEVAALRTELARVEAERDRAFSTAAEVEWLRAELARVVPKGGMALQMDAEAAACPECGMSEGHGHQWTCSRWRRSGVPCSIPGCDEPLPHVHDHGEVIVNAEAELALMRDVSERTRDDPPDLAGELEKLRGTLRADEPGDDRLTPDELRDLAEDIDATAAINPDAIFFYHPEIGGLGHGDLTLLLREVHHPIAKSAIESVIGEHDLPDEHTPVK